MVLLFFVVERGEGERDERDCTFNAGLDDSLKDLKRNIVERKKKSTVEGGGGGDG